jgi:hypothetical protein
MSSKRVSWHPDIRSPETPQRCMTCGYRKIAPSIREIIKCIICHRETCIHCLCSGDLCMDCNELKININ